MYWATFNSHQYSFDFASCMLSKANVWCGRATPLNSPGAIPKKAGRPSTARKKSAIERAAGRVPAGAELRPRKVYYCKKCGLQEGAYMPSPGGRKLVSHNDGRLRHRLATCIVLVPLPEYRYGLVGRDRIDSTVCRVVVSGQRKNTIYFWTLTMVPTPDFADDPSIPTRLNFCDEDALISKRSPRAEPRRCCEGASMHHWSALRSKARWPDAFSRSRTNRHPSGTADRYPHRKAQR